MVRIGLISDTHACIHPRVFNFLKDCDQIWHAGDLGNMETLETLAQFKPTIAVYGNVDDYKTRRTLPEYRYFMCEDCKVMMTHIGGYPGKYAKGISALIKEKRPDLFITGHSHILKVMYDAKNQLLYMNPGAAGQSGFHKNITALRFEIDKKECKNLEVLDIERAKKI
ncbi:MAG: metallophosphoesterase family protein [Bacteroidales bacterium]